MESPVSMYAAPMSFQLPKGRRAWTIQSSAGAVVNGGDFAEFAGFLVGESPFRGGEAVVEEAVAGAGDFGADEEVEAVDEVGGEEGLEDARAGVDEDVAGAGGLQVGDDGGGGGVEDAGAVPGGFGQGAGED